MSSRALILFLFIFSTWACRKESRLHWDRELLLPILDGQIGIEDILPDSLLKSNPDGSLHLSYELPILDTSFNEWMGIKDTLIYKSFRMKDFELSDIQITQGISLGQICEKGGITGATIIANHGSAITVPSLSSNTPNKQNIDAGAYFKSMEFASAQLDISLTNEFPIDMTQVIFSLNNASDNSVILLDTFQLIPANGGKVTHVIPLQNQKIESQLTGSILNIASPGSNGNPVMIDTAQKSIVSFSIRKAKIKSISAIFPSKELFNSETSLQFSLGNAELKQIEFSGGDMEINMSSTLPADLFFSVKSENITHSSGLFNEDFNIPSRGQTTIKKINLSQRKFNLKGGAGYNNLVLQVRGRIDSTGIVQTISENDSLTLTLNLKSPRIYKIEGYLGTSSHRITQKISLLSVTEKIPSGLLLFPEAEVSIKVTNPAGVDIGYQIHNISSVKNGKINLLQSTNFSRLVQAGRALDKPLRPVTSSIKVNESNSNLANFIGEFPDSIYTDAQLYINPAGNIWGWNDFLYGDSKIKASLSINIPLKGTANNLYLRDTIELPTGWNSNLKNILQGRFKCTSMNPYPISVQLKLTFFDADGNILKPDPVLSPVMMPGNIKPTEWNFEVQKGEFPIFMNAKKCLVEALFNTPGSAIQTFKAQEKISLKISAEITQKAESP